MAVTTRDPGRGAEFPRVAEVDGRMPELSGQALRDGRVVPADYRERVVVVNFWASWCTPCRQEQPDLEAFWRAHRDDGDVAVIGINYRDDRAAARAYLEEFEVSYPSLVDFPGTLLGAFGVPGLPATVVVDADGRMRFRVLGTVDREFLEDLVRRAAARSA